nr:immunoglobulin heavy chain junction region [Macaca mulatta]MOW48870.1 immunoglobulin heavy chain junction region [Macaca mulatta]MOW49290.1 immunoglobulin heavy chain junction region [Macaca mulatta]MOW50392.1 immunoglobulin heavy chain junction region [Macaca mulatta]
CARGLPVETATDYYGLDSW